MSLIFNAKAFDRIRPRTGTGFPLTKREKLRPPAGKIDNPVAQLVRFAISMGLPELSTKTVAALRDHPYYRYVFYGIFCHADSVSDNTFFAEHDRPRLLELLRDPDLLNDQDIYNGIEHYINNFMWYLPGGYYRTLAGMNAQPVVKAVDRALRLLGRSEKEVLSLLREMKEEQHSYDEYSNRVKFMKLALQAFDLVIKEGFDPATLWR